MKTQSGPTRSRPAAKAGKRRPGKAKKKASKESAPAQGEVPKKKRRKRAIELLVIDKVLGQFKKQVADDGFRVSTAEVAKLIQLKQEIAGSPEERGDVDLAFPGMPCLSTGSDS